MHRTRFRVEVGRVQPARKRTDLYPKFRILGIALLIILSAPVTSDEIESLWEHKIQEFEELDMESMPPEGAILFVGSSSIVFWSKLAEDMAPLAVINRGFGGSQMHELNEFRDRIVTNYNPRAIVIYEGDNDVALGKSPDEILASYDDFISHIDENLPSADICFIAVKPSIRREQLWPQMEIVNTGLKERSASRDDLCYLDIATPMMKGEGFVREDLFAADGLHLNRKGYEVWTETIRPILVDRYGSDSTSPATLQEKILPEKEH
ncbi:MAG: GDSL-type esterase/lipase family protein [Gammaproteobacteria bacterium]|nr:GDSL-type esterase/lipase family protein [Gammaproteobacteria bacterium]